jgi:hypothetical protein
MLITAAHIVHVDSEPSKQIHNSFEVIRAPDVGQSMETAVFIAEDPIVDIALLRINTPRFNNCIIFENTNVPVGACCGSLGFPLAIVTFTQKGKEFNLIERFQGSYISAFGNVTHPTGRNISIYETDALMYQGSSGCPGFLVNGKVFGMHNASRMDVNPQIKAETRLAISLWVSAADIIIFAKNNGITF